MSIEFPAIYEKGAFWPLLPVTELAEGSKVTISISKTVDDQGTTRPEHEPAGESLHALIQRKCAEAGLPDLGIPLEKWEEQGRLFRKSLSNVRDPEEMRQAAERMDRLSEQIRQREGVLDIVMPILREIRDTE